MTTSATHYEPSNKAGAASTMGMAAAGLAAAAAGAWVYQLLVDKIPFIYITFIISGGFGALIGTAVGVAGKATKCRKPGLIFMIALLAGIVGDLVSFRYAHDRLVATAMDDAPADVDVAALEEHLKTVDDLTALQRELIVAAARANGDVAAAKREFGIGKYIDLRVEEGWEIGRSSSGVPIRGFFVWIVWLLEAGIISVAAFVLAGNVANIPFDEASMTWMPAAANKTVRVNPETLAASVENNDVAGVLSPEIQRASPVEAKYTMYASKPADHAFVSVELTTKEGKDEKTEEVVRYLRITPEDWAGFLSHIRGGGTSESPEPPA